jgi:hypothetical protein
MNYFMGHNNCRNLNHGLATKARGCKVAGQERETRECKECEGMNPHTPKWTPMLGVGVPNELPNFQSAIVGVKTHRLEELFISLESYWSVDV